MTAGTTTDRWTELEQAHARATPSPRAGDGTAPPHRPVAAVLTCADARVSPTRLFDLAPGSLFVVRVAGNIATPEAVASLTYAVEHLAVDTVVVLGHTHCGAVTAAMQRVDEPALESLLAPIRPSAEQCDDLSCAVPANVEATVAALRRDAGPLGRALRDGRAAVHGAVVDIVDDSITHLPIPQPIH